ACACYVYSSLVLLLSVLEQAPRTTLTRGPKSGVHFTGRLRCGATGAEGPSLPSSARSACVASSLTVEYVRPHGVRGREVHGSDRVARDQRCTVTGSPAECLRIGVRTIVGRRCSRGRAGVA